MGIFFVAWDLWQEMTFVLGCCILLVSGMGVIKLWWTNRALHRLEMLDDEKQARLLTMRYCGMNARGIDEIPFGIRAIQRGVEVDGIWICHPNPTPASQVASSATWVADQTGLSGQSNRWTGSTATTQTQTQSAQISEYSPHCPRGQVRAVSGPDNSTPRSTLNSSKIGTILSAGTGSVGSHHYGPSGWQREHRVGSSRLWVDEMAQSPRAERPGGGRLIADMASRHGLYRPTGYPIQHCNAHPHVSPRRDEGKQDFASRMANHKLPGRLPKEAYSKFSEPAAQHAAQPRKLRKKPPGSW